MSGALGRIVSPDWEHVDRFPLTAAAIEAITVPTPVVIGVNWYTAFDSPVKDSSGHYWIGRDPKQLGSVRGGHCVCLKPRGVTDLIAWWDFYDQFHEGACVGFGATRCMSLINRKRYFARWLWDRAKDVDGFSDTNPGDDNGTTVRAALDVLRERGHVPWKASYASMDDQPADSFPRSGLSPVLGEGISANRWIRSMDDMLAVLGYSGLDYCDVINSWGRSFPHLTRIPVATLERLWREDGEFGVPTDR